MFSIASKQRKVFILLYPTLYLGGCYEATKQSFVFRKTGVFMKQQNEILCLENQVIL